ncbi:glycosyltransferase family 2 protein [Ornithinimicrobium murale]|uniref:glycosyltransferase family 2 protein n=1 Tax=Ornithinimicrobium murale TaxID=1050153 RepID=UPI001EE014D6|nr:glycosyltransferase family 2 protein [Ornithinimicrobium murale]
MSLPYPPVSVIMPVLNEERHLAEAVRSVLAQEYAGELEVVVAVGPSRDRTLQVAEEVVASDPRVTLVQNPTGRTPDSLNAALAAARHEIIVRMDGHGELSPGYIARAVRVMQETGAANVGGVMAAEGQTDFERAVALAMRSRLGLGSARFHVGGPPGPAETVFLGVFQRDWLRRVGGYDSTYSRAQDWEMNWRIRQMGGTVWFDPELEVTYRPRPDFGALARQYFTTGQWRRRVMRQHPSSVSARYLAPPVALVAVVAGGVGGLVWRPALLAPLGYAVAVTVGGLAMGARQGPSVALRVPAVLTTMHMAWGAGFLRGTSRD